MSECTHDDVDRVLDGTWISLEIIEALNQGYKVVKTYEVWHHPDSDIYDHAVKKGGLFTEHVDLFLKYKQEASGFPSNVITEQEKMDYIKNYFDTDNKN